MHHAPQYGRLLEMIEPPLAIRRIDQCPLMRTVYMGRALFEHNLTFVGAIDIFRTQHRLPASSYTPFGNNQIIPAIALQEFRALSHRSLIDRHTFIEQQLAIGRHLMHNNRPCTMFAAP